METIIDALATNAQQTSKDFSELLKNLGTLELGSSDEF